MNFSFFYSRGGSGYIRGEQMADYLGGKKNPKSGFEDDICIYVKIIPPENHPKHSYLDVDDAPRAVAHLKTHSELGVIAISKTAKDFISKTLKRDDVIFIPHQHCNYERWIRPERKVKTVGIIGSKTSFQYSIDDFRKKLKKVGLELSYEEDYWNTYKGNKNAVMRVNVANFHKTIDIQVVWRPHRMHANSLRNPNKLGNASSFGIPTVAYPEQSYVAEWGGYFIPTMNIISMVGACEKLKENKDYYNHYAQRALVKAEEYHVDKIAELYKKL